MESSPLSSPSSLSSSATTMTESNHDQQEAPLVDAGTRTTCSNKGKTDNRDEAIDDGGGGDDSDDSEEDCFFADATLDLEDARCIEEMNASTPAIIAGLQQQQQQQQQQEQEQFEKGDEGNSQLLHRFQNNGNDTTHIATTGTGTSNNDSNHDNIETANNNTIHINANNTNNTNNNHQHQLQLQQHSYDASIHVLAPTTQPKPPTRFRDVIYIVMFIAAITICFLLFITSYLFGRNNDNHDNNDNGNNDNNSNNYYYYFFFHQYTILPTIITTLTSILLSKFIYTTRGGDEGDDARFTISSLLMFFHFLYAVLLLPIVTLQVYYLRIGGSGSGSGSGSSIDDDMGNHDDGLIMIQHVSSIWWYKTLLGGLIGLTLYEIYSFALLFKSIKTNNNAINNNIINNNNNITTITNNNNINFHESINDGKRTMFRMILNVALDVLSRSLRPKAFFRYMVFAILAQFILLQLLLHFLQIVYYHIGGGGGGGRVLMVVFVVSCFWICYLGIKILMFCTCGGVTTWFTQQALFMEEMQLVRNEQQHQQHHQHHQQIQVSQNEVGDDEYNGVSTNTTGQDLLMPEAYRNVNASAYSSMMMMELDAQNYLDDDSLEEDEEDFYTNKNNYRDGVTTREFQFDIETNHDLSNPNYHQNQQQSSFVRSHGRRSHRGNGRDWQHCTMKSFLYFACTISLGSILQCAIMSPIVNVLYHAIYYMDWIMTIFMNISGGTRHQRNRMNIEMNNNGSGDGSGHASTIQKECGRGRSVRAMDYSEQQYMLLAWQEKVYYKWKRLERVMQSFVYRHHELGLCHVAAYHKKYQKASFDVMTLLHSSGTLSIMTNDISSHMCTSIPRAISIMLTIIVGHTLTTSSPSTSEGLDHVTICQIMIVTFIMSFVILNTFMEPLRASMVAVYVSFAQHPQSLSQAFPLLYHRLNRISMDSQ